jgi:hypothetical protein
MFYVELFKQLDADHVRYMVVGGLAMNLLGVPRSTMDIDLVLALDDANLRQFLATAKCLSLRPVAPVPLEDFLSAEKRRQWQKSATRYRRGAKAGRISSGSGSAPAGDLHSRPDRPQGTGRTGAGSGRY